jgi:1,4-alpha-glucan branching enzyme
MLKKSSAGAVTFIFDGESKDPVFLVGDFNNWNNSATKLSKVAGKWQTKISLKPGKYAYKYFVNGNWVNDSAADEYRTNPYGQQDSVLNVCGKCSGKSSKGKSSSSKSPSSSKTTKAKKTSKK